MNNKQQMRLLYMQWKERSNATADICMLSIWLYDDDDEGSGDTTDDGNSSSNENRLNKTIDYHNVASN